MIKYSFLIISIAIIILSCNESNKKNPTLLNSSDNAPQSSVLDFSGTDSLELFNYPDPNQPKQYTFFGSSDTSLINSIIENIAGAEISRQAPCPHHRKIFLFQNKEVFKTLYLSDSCKYVAYAINGSQVYKPLQSKLREKLNNAYLQQNK